MAVLIMSLAFLILVGAVGAAARINKKAKNESVRFRTIASSDTTKDATIGGTPIQVKLYGSTTDGGYYYYEYVK